MVNVTPEPTPNPNAVKFTLDRAATPGRAQTVRAGSDPAESPLGSRVFGLDGVTNVFLTANFVSVTKEDDVDWEDLGPAVIAEIQQHFAEESG